VKPWPDRVDEIAAEIARRIDAEMGLLRRVELMTSDGGSILTSGVIGEDGRVVVSAFPSEPRDIFAIRVGDGPIRALVRPINVLSGDTAYFHMPSAPGLPR
jgi:hypothetical protein